MASTIQKWALVTFVGLSLLACPRSLANQYDDEERIRRWAEKEAQKEQAERDAAKRRIDKEEAANRPSSGDGMGGFACLGFVVFVVFLVYMNRNRR